MFMGTAFIVDTQQSGPRGGDKLYSPNIFMAARGAPRRREGRLSMRPHAQPRPRHHHRRALPVLFQTGETAYGHPLFDAQHPHNFIMALGFHYAYEIAEDTTIDLYVAPVGDPALGPVAYPHRASAEELPEATLSHHLQDSTHISDDVVTVGIAHKKLKLEASGFHGAEPGENRWIIQQAASIPGPRASGFSPPKTGPRNSPSDGSTHPEAWSPAIRSAPPARSAIQGRLVLQPHLGTGITSPRHFATPNSYLPNPSCPSAAKTSSPAASSWPTRTNCSMTMTTCPVNGSIPHRRLHAGLHARHRSVLRVQTGIGAISASIRFPMPSSPTTATTGGGNIFVRFRLRKSTCIHSARCGVLAAGLLLAGCGSPPEQPKSSAPAGDPVKILAFYPRELQIFLPR